MQPAETTVLLILLAFIAWPSTLKRFANPAGKLALVALTAYLANHDALLGCAAAVVFVRVFLQVPTSTWRPPRTDRLGLDVLLRPQESFFKPIIRTPGEPISEIHLPYTLF